MYGTFCLFFYFTFKRIEAIKPNIPTLAQFEKVMLRICVCLVCCHSYMLFTPLYHNFKKNR